MLLLLLLSRFSCVWLCRPHRRQATRLPHSWDSPGKNTGVVAISFSSAWKWKVKVKPLSRVRLLATPWTAAHQAPLGFSRQEHWSGCHCLLCSEGESSIKDSKRRLKPVELFISSFVHVQLANRESRDGGRASSQGFASWGESERQSLVILKNHPAISEHLSQTGFLNRTILWPVSWFSRCQLHSAEL